MDCISAENRRFLCSARSSAVDTTICRRVTASGRVLILTRWFSGLDFSSALRSLPDVDPVIANCVAGSNGSNGSSECSNGSDSVITLFCFMVFFCRQALFFCKLFAAKQALLLPSIIPSIVLSISFLPFNCFYILLRFFYPSFLSLLPPSPPHPPTPTSLVNAYNTRSITIILTHLILKNYLWIPEVQDMFPKCWCSTWQCRKSMLSNFSF